MLASQIGNMMPGARQRCGRHMRLRQTFSPNKKIEHAQQHLSIGTAKQAPSLASV